MKTPITVALVGTRRADAAMLWQVRDVLMSMPLDVLILTGHAGGVCGAVRVACMAAGKKWEVLHPGNLHGQDRVTVVRMLYARDAELVRRADLVLAWPAPDRRGGTEEEIRQSKRQGRPCLLCVGPPPWSWAGVAPDLVPAWLAGLVLPPMAVQATLITA